MTALILVASVLILASPLRQVNPETPRFVVVVNRANPETRADTEGLTLIFLRHRKTWSNGEAIQAVDQSMASPIRSGFTTAVFRQQSSAIQTYWQGEVAAGRDTPPPVRASDEAVLTFVAANVGAIGYVSSAAKLPPSIRVLRIEP